MSIAWNDLILYATRNSSTVEIVFLFTEQQIKDVAKS